MTLISCQSSNDFAGKWYAPNGLIEISLSKDGSFESKTIYGTSKGTWQVNYKTILLSDSTILRFDSVNLLLADHKLTRNKPEANTPTDVNLAGLKFYRTFELQGKQKDTLTFSDTSYYSSFNKRSYRYKLIEWNELLYFSDSNLANLGDRYALIEGFDGIKLKLNFYQNETQKHVRTEWIKI